LGSVKYVSVDPELRTKIFYVLVHIKEHMLSNGIDVLPGDTHIVPIMVRDAKKCKAISDWLLEERAIYLQPINYPTVPWGAERLRCTPTPNHTESDIDYLTRSLKEIL
jgi:5-aminolevulinate synthase